jgi:D-glycero-beta-D-manno-heptose-7-phosphate kinase
MNVDQLFNQFLGKKIAVIGDVMLDTYLEGKVQRISPEAPVPIVNFEKEDNRLGGAANVALNLISLGAEVELFSVIGNDDSAKILLNLLLENNISTFGILQSSNRKTTVKKRIIGNRQQLLRIDYEQTNLITATEENDLIKRGIEILKSGIEVLIFQDYDKGVLTKKIIKKLVDFCNQNNIKTAVDPKKNNFFNYKNVTIFKPNLKELREGTNLDFQLEDQTSFESCVDSLKSKLNNQITFVTLSEKGVFISDKANKHYIPAHLRSISDVSGAGDTVISVASMCLAANMSIREIAEISNLAGGLVCEEKGVVCVEKKKLAKEILQKFG